MSTSKKRTNTTFKTPLLNDCTNHLAFQLELDREQSMSQRGATHEAPIPDVVTYEFVRGYN